MAIAGRPWYQTFFEDAYLQVYGKQLTAERSAQEAAFILKALDLRPGEAVLDLCSGQGRHAVLLAQAGMQLTCIDLQRAYLDLAEAAAAAAGVQIETLQSDMRDIPFEGRFDAAYCAFSSLGQLESDEQDERVLFALSKALKPDGRLLLDMPNRDWTVAHSSARDWHLREDGSVLLQETSFDPRTSVNHVGFWEVGPDGTRREVGEHHLRLYTLNEVTRMLATAGLSLSAVYGNFSGKSFRLHRERMIIVATKK